MEHQHFSFIKSGLRFLGYIYLLFNMSMAVSLLIASEIIGVVEEIGH